MKKIFLRTLCQLLSYLMHTSPVNKYKFLLASSSVYLLFSMGLILPSTVFAINAGCSAFPTEVTLVEGDPGAISLNFGYSNDSADTVTFTTTRTDNTGSTSGTIDVGPELGVAQNPASQLEGEPVGYNIVNYEITSNATGDTVLGSCEYTLKGLGKN